MKRTKVYIDTSVFRGCFDPEFARWSKGLFENSDREVYHPVISELVEAEDWRAPRKSGSSWRDFWGSTRRSSGRIRKSSILSMPTE